MRDLTSSKLIYAKGVLFLIASLLASSILIVQDPRALTILLLAIAIWAFARFYYFAFYVIEKYVDARYRFTGMISLLRYLFAQKRL
jgi:hypothetical protein